MLKLVQMIAGDLALGGRALRLTVKSNYGDYKMPDMRPELDFMDIGAIASGSIVSYATFLGSLETVFGLLLVFFTLLLTLMRILIAIHQWRYRNKQSSEKNRD